jgi:hypothetical protein
MYSADGRSSEAIFRRNFACGSAMYLDHAGGVRMIAPLFATRKSSGARGYGEVEVAAIEMRADADALSIVKK